MNLLDATGWDTEPKSIDDLLRFMRDHRPHHIETALFLLPFDEWASYVQDVEENGAHGAIGRLLRRREKARS